MPRTEDKDLLRAILNQDRAWAVYPLGDLDDRHFPHCEWYVDHDSFLLIYCGAATPVLVAGGDPATCAALVDEAGCPAPASLHVRPELLPFLASRYARLTTRSLVRMRLVERVPVNTSGCVLLSAHDVPDLLKLYDAPDGPEFFFPTMLDSGSYFGIREDGQLIAAAGTHLLSETESVAAIGNVYTYAGERGRGLAARTTSAVAQHLEQRGIQTIALSVVASNHIATRVYQRLGFEIHCPFVDGLADRVCYPEFSLVEARQR